MGFETVILSVTKDVVRHSRAEFTNGTLFVGNIDETEANRLVNNFRNYAQCEVVVSEVGGEFAFDFV